MKVCPHLVVTQESALVSDRRMAGLRCNGANSETGAVRTRRFLLLDWTAVVQAP